MQRKPKNKHLTLHLTVTSLDFQRQSLHSTFLCSHSRVLVLAGNHPRGSHDRQNTESTRNFFLDFSWLFLQIPQHSFCSFHVMELGASLLYLFVLKCDAAILSYPLVNSTEMKL
jgi:hypothetical protein